MDLVFVHPEIPHNSGCAARLSAALGLRLHLVEPLGFSLEDRYLKRAGLDYWPMVDLVVHRSVEALRAHFEREGRPFAQRARLFSARGGTSLFATQFAPDDILLYVPIRAGVRSLNLANVACLSVYTAMVSAGLPLPDNQGQYAPHELSAVDIKPSSRATRVDQ